MYGTSGFKQFPFRIAVLFMTVSVGLRQKAMCIPSDSHSCCVIGHRMRYQYCNPYK